jgi:uncharacterized protein (TIGR02231 family)
MRPFLLSLFFIHFLASGRGEGGSTVVLATLRSVTVYRSGAEMVHTAAARLNQGNNELIIDGISNVIDPASIRISCSGNVTIMSVAFSADYLKPETASPFVKKLQDSITGIKKELDRLGALTSADNEQLDVLNANKNISGVGVTVAELSKMLDYYRQKVLDLRTELNGYQERVAQLKGQQELLESQIREEESKNTKTGGSLTLQLLSPLAGSCDLTISHLTTAAHWNPSYDLRVQNTNEPLHLLYKARLVQTSGIDWKQVKLSLSTANPVQNNSAPVVRTWFLRFDDPTANVLNSAGYANTGNGLMGRVAGVAVRGVNSLNEVVVTGLGVSNSGDRREYTEPLYVVNGQEISEEEYKKIDPRAFRHVDHLKGEEATAIYRYA